ncbi:hypothetical protein [Ureibacillus sinduriensis]|uniref:HEAT repeat domain-containing protein n=1 Tax=Ureibacillus sinduriensis BLB-1 = JCM 15800 TaxID=1384057 RepID=A0A0A3HU43_9BACL|nr:hypothetical protein [Ureibacillus sinduriensis]KGR76126.1 hypothetical protein CD33_08080 [Ureibacillus sinduriensis BLB-1 = JCM 15800]
MTVLTRLASQLDRKDERPNIELARELMESNNIAGIQEIIENLAGRNQKIKSDCVKVAYEIGKEKPELICDYAEIFIDLLKSPNNRLVWGAMQVLSTIAEISAITLMKHVHTIKHAVKTGTVITTDKGILTLAKLAAVNEYNHDAIFPFLLGHLNTCRTKEIPQHAESILLAVADDETKVQFLNVLKEREPYMTKPQARRIQKIYSQLKV